LLSIDLKHEKCGRTTKPGQVQSIRAWSQEGKPDSVEDGPRAALRWALWLAAESRLRVRQQQHRIQPGEFDEGDFRFQFDPDSGKTTEERVFLPEEEGL